MQVLKSRGGQGQGGGSRDCQSVTLGNSGKGVGSALLPTLRKWAREEEEQEHGVSGPWGPGPWDLLPVSFLELVCLEPGGSKDGQ